MFAELLNRRRFVILFSKLPTFHGDRICLRPVRLTDVKDVFDFSSDPIVTNHMTWQAHLNEQATLQFLEYLQGQYEIGESADWGIEFEGKLIGYCSFVEWSEQDKSAEIGYILHRQYWGQGLMVEAVKHLFHYGFIDKGFNRIEARCNDDNANSERVMQKLHMSYEGLFREDRYIKGKFRHTKVYSLLRREYDQIFHQ